MQLTMKMITSQSKIHGFRLAWSAMLRSTGSLGGRGCPCGATFGSKQSTAGLARYASPARLSRTNSSMMASHAILTSTGNYELRVKKCEGQKTCHSNQAIT
eukprot:48035-Amphidinium_carterae.1